MSDCRGIIRIVQEKFTQTASKDQASLHLSELMADQIYALHAAKKRLAANEHQEAGQQIEEPDFAMIDDGMTPVVYTGSWAPLSRAFPNQILQITGDLFLIADKMNLALGVSAKDGELLRMVNRYLSLEMQSRASDAVKQRTILAFQRGLASRYGIYVDFLHNFGF